MNRDTNVTAVTEVQAGKGPPRDTVLLGKYRVESTLGFGGMGLVIKAHNVDLDEPVAIKLLREDVELDGDNIARFLREAKNAVKLKSEHVARIHDVGQFQDGRPYMVMELLEGLDLGKILLDHGSIDRPRAVDLLLQACDAIAEAHAVGIVHRDIKPTNLFVTKRRDGTDLLKVLDFGISKAMVGADLSLTQTQSMLGTPAYMSPEQMRSARTVDPRSDIWSLGCVLYELCEGRPPFDASNFAELCVMVSIEQYAPMTNAPELTRIMDQALAKSADMRFQDVADLAFALEPYASDQERSYRQVARVYRLLGRVHPDSRDSTPIPVGTRTPVRVATAALPRTPTHEASSTYVIERSGVLKTILFFAVLFGVGLGVTLLITGGDSEPTQPVSDEVSEPAPAGSAETATREMTIARDAAVAEVEDAGTAEAVDDAIGSGSARVRPPPKKQPSPKKPPRRVAKPPARPTTTPATPAKPPATPPKPPVTPTPAKPKCDPFDNPKGCH